jgi:hypothetical protein
MKAPSVSDTWGPLIEQERAAGRHFVEKYHGHRLLIDCIF